jgi:hypothetical protein
VSTPYPMNLGLEFDLLQPTEWDISNMWISNQGLGWLCTSWFCPPHNQTQAIDSRMRGPQGEEAQLTNRPASKWGQLTPSSSFQATRQQKHWNDSRWGQQNKQPAEPGSHCWATEKQHTW